VCTTEEHSWGLGHVLRDKERPRGSGMLPRYEGRLCDQKRARGGENEDGLREAAGR